MVTLRSFSSITMLELPVIDPIEDCLEDFRVVCEKETFRFNVVQNVIYLYVDNKEEMFQNTSLGNST